MEMLCPSCLGTMVTDDGRHAVCTVDGKRFQILFTRHALVSQAPFASSAEAAASSAAPPPLPGTPGAPPVPVAPVVQQDNDIYDLSPEEFAQPGMTTASATFDTPLQQLATAYQNPYAPSHAAVPAGTICRTHPEMPAVAYCRTCATPVCATCDFAYPGGVHLCPNCATTPKQTIGPKRKGMIIAAYILAGVATLGLILTGVVAAGGGADAVNVVALFFYVIPAVTGFGLAGGSMEKRLGNPGVVWGAVIWNSLLFALMVLAIFATVVFAMG